MRVDAIRLATAVPPLAAAAAAAAAAATVAASVRNESELVPAAPVASPFDEAPVVEAPSTTPDEDEADEVDEDEDVDGTAPPPRPARPASEDENADEEAGDESCV